MEATLDRALEKLEKKHGGVRAGAGKKAGSKNRKTLVKEAAQMYLIRQVEENIAELTAALLDKAKESDVGAIKEAFDRAWGRSREKMEMTVLLPIPLDEIRKDHRVPEDKEPQ